MSSKTSEDSRGDIDTEIDKPRVVTFGEFLVRLAAPNHLLLEQASTLEVSFGGAEANVAVSLARFGVPVRYVTRVPDTPITRTGRRLMQGFHVDTSHFIIGGDRVGLYFVEPGIAQRPSRVVYDRTGSGMASIQTGDILWRTALEGCTWFHTSGITPALSESASASTMEAVIAAQASGLTVSLDLNYRAQLWQWSKNPGKVMADLVSHADVVFSNEEDLDKVFGIRVPHTTAHAEALDSQAYAPACKEFLERFPNLREVAVTIRESESASENYWSAVLATREGFYCSQRYRIAPVLDRIGAGDAFAAASIRQMLSVSADPQAVVEFAAAASCLKHSIRGDFNLVGVADVARLAGGDGAGRIDR
jgi:2-dehydro-3-deoxygluconokinase